MAKVMVGLGAAMVLDMSTVLWPRVDTSAWAKDALLPTQNTKEKQMPHVSVKLWPGRSEEEKKELAEAITEDVVRITGSSHASVSVSIEDIPSSEWKERVYDPEVRDKAELLFKKPGYSM